MDGGAYRPPRQTDRGPTKWRPEESKEKPREERVVNPPAEPAVPVESLKSDGKNASQNTPRKRPLLLIILVIVLIMALASWIVWSKLKTSPTAIDSAKYQAVLLTNGESYFGKLADLNEKFMRLTDIFYLQSQANEDEDAETELTDESNFQLIKLGAEIQGPEDEMIISKDQIIYYENLKPDGKVSDAIDQYKRTN